jgi:hypothetical protein
MLAHERPETSELLSGTNIDFYVVADIADPAIAVRQKVFGAFPAHPRVRRAHDYINILSVCVEELDHANTTPLQQSSGAIGMLKIGN